ncbi:MAG: hypothetical protein OXT67_12875 [Zetaproteobacteria bacterium]|nr:hypothetical protein [Zetaproteobacteria bacterium]
MIQLEHTDYIASNADCVYQLVRDHLTELASYLPSVHKIEQIKSSQHSPTETQIENHWYASVELPKLIATYIPENLMRWKDSAHWNDETKQVQYKLASFVGNQLFSAEGTNEFLADGEQRMILKVSCQVEIHGDAIPGIPKILSRRATPMIEKLIERMIAPNITSLGSGIKSYLQEHEA